MYRVHITTAGTYRAIKAGTDPESKDLATSFESDYWQQFQQELKIRLHDDAQQIPREIAPGKERRKRDS